MAEIDLGAPWRGAKEGYLQNYFITRQNFGSMLLTITSYADPRIPLMTDFLISAITDDTTRYAALALKKDSYQEYLLEMEDPSEEEKAQCLARACMDTLGHITAWYDEFLGITNKQTFDVIPRHAGEDESVGRYYGNKTDVETSTEDNDDETCGESSEDPETGICET